MRGRHSKKRERFGLWDKVNLASIKNVLDMSKIGNKPISIPEGVKVSATQDVLKVEGPKGELTTLLHPKVRVDVKAGEVSVSVDNPEQKLQRSLWGTFRSLTRNMVTGVTEGFEKRLEIIGVGFRASVSGEKLVLNIGYSHPVETQIPEGLEVKVEKNTIVVSGADKQQVGEFAAVIRQRRPPEPYKGKGIKYEDEVIRRKAGKVAKAIGEGA